MRSSLSVGGAAIAFAVTAAAAASCGGSPPNTNAPASPTHEASGPMPGRRTPERYGRLEREELNRLAVHLNLPLFWIADSNGNGSVDPNEIASLLFYPSSPTWVNRGGLTPDFDRAYDALVRASRSAPPADRGDARRIALVLRELDQGRQTLVRNDLRSLPQPEKSFVRRMLRVAKLIDDLYDRQTGAAALRSALPANDPASASLFRRNRGPRCVAPKTESIAACSAIPGSPKPLVDAYPHPLQLREKFCQSLEGRPDAKKLLTPFSVVRPAGHDDPNAEDPAKAALEPIPYSRQYRTPMRAIAEELRAAARDLSGAGEDALVQYLDAASESFEDNDWDRADEAWSRMNANDSKWFLRVGPDEVYWDPCNQKAGFHMVLARINLESLAWQAKLSPVQQEMEKLLASLIGPPYRARAVSFHLPDFIDITINAGDSRSPLGATIGQSLPNWGKVAREGRGRTVAMSNLYTDADSVRIRRQQAASLLTAESLKTFTDATTPGLLSTILHEAAHNLGPSHEYSYRGKKDSEAFGGGLATLLEELKAQTASLYFVDFLVRSGIIDERLAHQTYTDSIVWAFGHISRGMWTSTGKRKPYSQLSAVQIGFLLDAGAISFEPKAVAANGRDRSAFVIHHERLATATEELMRKVGRIKATNDRAGAEALTKKYVEEGVVPHTTIAERFQRFPRASFVYSVEI